MKRTIIAMSVLFSASSFAAVELKSSENDTLLVNGKEVVTTKKMYSAAREAIEAYTALNVDAYGSVGMLELGTGVIPVSVGNMFGMASTATLDLVNESGEYIGVTALPMIREVNIVSHPDTQELHILTGERVEGFDMSGTPKTGYKATLDLDATTEFNDFMQIHPLPWEYK